MQYVGDEIADLVVAVLGSVQLLPPHSRLC
jgi:hypothetical protein